MIATRLIVPMCTLGIAILIPNTTYSQDYPNKPIRIITTSTGGSGDLTARLIAQEITGPLGQPVVIDNRGGGNVVPAEAASKAPPDGYTLLVVGAAHWIGPLLQKTPYDPVRDFAPVSMAVMEPFLVVVHPSMPVKSIPELIAFAKARPGQINYGSGIAGTQSHLSGALFKSLSGVNINGVPYSDNARRISELIGGQTQMMIDGAGSLTPYVKSGQVRALAVGSARPSTLFPGLPTVASTLPGFETGSSQNVFAPAKTPDAIVNRVSQEVARGLNRPDVKQKFSDVGLEVVANTPAEFAEKIRADMALWSKVIKDTGIKAE